MSDDRAAQNAYAYWNQFRTAFYFDKPGDEIAGALLEHETEGPAKDPIPRLVIQTKEGKVRVVLASQERLKAALQDACPAQGDRLRIVYTGDAPRAAPGMTPSKLFTVEVRRPGQKDKDPRAGVGTEGVRGSAPSENVPPPGATP